MIRNVPKTRCNSKNKLKINQTFKARHWNIATIDLRLNWIEINLNDVNMYFLSYFILNTIKKKEREKKNI